MMSEAELKATELAGRQSGYITLRQSLACGMSPDSVKRRVQAKRWIRVRPGLFLIPGFEPSLRGRLLAATAALGAVVSHESAGGLHDLPGVRRGMAVVTVRTRTTNRFPDVRVHQTTDLNSRRVVELEGLPVTDVVRTVIDLASSMPVPAIGRIIDHLVIRGPATIDDFADEVMELARHGKPGMKTMHTVLRVRDGARFIGDSRLEMWALRLIREWGFPEPEVQYPLPWRSSRNGRVDFAYPVIRLIIEVDGRAWHTTLEAFESDRLRDNHAQLAGWRVLRITYRMLVEQPEIVRDMIRRAFEMSNA